VFARWGDLAYYTPAPQGDLETSSLWSLASGAAIAADNETFGIGTHALSLRTGTAVSPAACVDVTQPTVRFFARNTGDPGSKLNVEVLFQDLTGHQRTLAIASLTAGAAWAPTPIIPLYVNQLAAVSPSGTTSVSLRFSVSGGNGAWVVDDLQIDPWRPR
jgi:hypothetical protein